uniref:Uncharacterized protein n=1 Tax=Rangifer tarandus platyrhynchus TaxID=3082113 RepID=A0ACB0EQW3_RANTA|nr:unnamed protein product [Rangifer tarandus platyrhynchus]
MRHHSVDLSLKSVPAQSSVGPGTVAPGRPVPRTMVPSSEQQPSFLAGAAEYTGLSGGSTAGLFVTLPVPVWGSSAFLVGRTPRLIGGLPSSQHQPLSSALTPAV